MTVQLNWLNEPWSMAIAFSDHITVDDIREIIRVCLPRLRENPIYFLIDMTDVTDVDRRILELSSLSEWIYHPKGRWFVYVRPHPLFSGIMKMRHRGNYKAFDHYQDALAFVESASLAEKKHRLSSFSAVRIMQ